VLRQAPVYAPETEIIAKRPIATPRHLRNPSIVGDAGSYLTTRLTITKINVQIVSIKKA